MKKNTLTIIILAFILLASCKKENPDALIGTYKGNIKTNTPLTVHAGSNTNIVDTTFTTMESTAVITKSDFEDTLMLTITLGLDPEVEFKEIPAFKVSNTEIRIDNYAYYYLGSIPIMVKGSATIEKENLKTTVEIFNADAAIAIDNTNFKGELDYSGTKQ